MSVLNNSIYTLRRNLWTITSDSELANFFMFAGRSKPWPNDNDPPAPTNSIGEMEYTINNEILFGKYLPASSMNLMINRYDWESGTVYDMYDDQDPDLFSKKFYVITQEAGDYHVFKCLNNNGGAESLYQPLLSETAADDAYYSTADDYQWKYMFSFDVSQYNTFATPSYIPVTPNTAVTSNAVGGAIETYKIESPGGNYNSYTNGYFTDVQVGGNNQLYTIQGSDKTILSVSQNNFVVGEKVTQVYSGVLANGTVTSVTSSGATTILAIGSVNGVFAAGANVVVGVTSGKQSIVIDESSPEVSSNSNFYNGCSLYISSGTGAGQVRNILQYIVVGNSRRVLVDSAFTTIPDFTSKYVIAPRVMIRGDGAGASALSIIDPATKQLKDIRVINAGSGYTYANVFIYGNTGSTALASNNAVVRAIYSPRGGHGANVYSELNSTYMCYSATFNQTESGKIPGTGSTYRRVGVFTDPLFSNVNVEYTYTTDPSFPLVANLKVMGMTSGAYGILNSIDAAANTVNLTRVNGLFSSGELITAIYANGVTAVSTSSNTRVDTVTGQGNVFDARTCLICPTATLTGGTFAVNDKIVQIGGGGEAGALDTGYAVIQRIDTSGSDTYIYLTEVQGTFMSSDTGTSTYKYIYDDATRQVRIQVDEIIAPDIIPFTGEIIYAENIEPVTRNSLQSETVKLILGFN